MLKMIWTSLDICDWVMTDEYLADFEGVLRVEGVIDGS
jgi:hypothetical protein